MDMGNYFKEPWDLTLKNLVSMIIGCLVGLIVTVLTLGVLGVAIYPGVHGMYLKAKKGEEVKVGDVFMYTGKFFPLLVATLVLGLLVFIGLLLLIVPGILFMTWWMYVPMLVADKGLSLSDAMRVSKEAVTGKGGTFMHFLFLLVVGFIGGIGNAVFGIGTLFTLPLAWGALAMAYSHECG